MNSLFRIIASILSLYSLMCFLRIILTWIPGMSYSRFTNFLASVCDPYLNLFRRFRFLQMGSFDFSPALALCILGAASSLVSNLSHGARVSLGMVLGMAVEVVFSIVNSLIFFLLILFIIRIIMLFVQESRERKNNSYSYGFRQSSPLTDAVDRSISPIVYRIAGTFTAGRQVSYRAALLISTISLAVLQVVLGIALKLIVALLFHLPL